MKILVIRLKQIGDALISLPVCKSLKLTFPDSRVDYLVYEHIAPLFENHPAVDNILVITPEERRNKWLYLRKMWSIRSAGYDMVIDLLTVPITAIMTHFSGAKWQIGFDKGKWRSHLYKTAVPHPNQAASLEAKLSILEGLPVPARLTRDFDVVLRQDEIESMRETMGEAGLSPDKPTLLFSPISRLSYKNWPMESFAVLIDHCVDRYDVNAVMIWGPGERPLVDQLVSRLRQPAGVCTSIPTPDLRRLAALARNSSLFIGNDSGPRHVAEAVGIPTFTIFSPPISKFAWLPHQGERHQGIDMCDALNIDEQTWHQRASEFNKEMEKYYAKITPELAISRLEPMLRLLS